MGFLAPKLLWLLFLAGVPLVIHLIQRIQLKKMLFSSLFFLSETKREKFTWLQLKEILLLIFRTAFILFLLLSLARPYFKRHLPFGRYDASRVIVLDDSYSMAYGQNFLQAKLQIRKLLKELSRNSEVAIISSSGKIETDFIRQKWQLEKMLDTLAVSYSANTLEEALYRAIKKLANATYPQKEIFVVSDLQKSAIEPIVSLLSAQHSSSEVTRANFWIVEVGSKNPVNVGINEIFLNPSFPTPDLPARVCVKLKNYSEKNNNVILQCNIGFTELDGRPAVIKETGKKFVSAVQEAENLQAEVSLKSNEEKIIAFDTEIKKPGCYQIQAMIKDDSLPIDNQYYYSAIIPQTTPILLVYENRSDIYYIEKALAQSYFEITTLEYKSLRQHNLNKYRAIGIFSPSHLSYADWERLGYFVQQGKGLLVVLDKEIKEPRWRQALNLSLDLTSGLPLTSTSSGFVTLEKINYSHPIMEIFREVDLGSAKFFSYFELNDAMIKSNLALRQKQTLAYFSSGKPFLIEDPQQRIIIALSAFNLQSTDFMFKTTFLPLFHRIFTYLALGDLPRKYQVGDTVRVQFAKLSPTMTVKIKTPTSEIYEPIKQTSIAESQSFIEFSQTLIPGFYQIQEHFFSVNVSPEEGHLLKISEEILKNQGISIINDVAVKFTDLSRTSIFLAILFFILELVVLCL